MKAPFNKKTIATVSSIAIVVAFIFPFLIRTADESLNATLSYSYGAASTVATFIGLYFVIQLYDRYGLGGKFIEKQTETVLELANLLKGKVINGHTGKFIYMIRARKNSISQFEDINEFQADRKKLLLVNSEDFQKAMHPISVLRRNYWMPAEIKKKLEFFDPPLLRRVESAENYVTLLFYTDQLVDLGVIYPDITYEQFLKHYQDLVVEIEVWLKKHSEVLIDLKLEEGN